MTRPVSVQLYTLRQFAEKDLLGVLRRVAEMGYDAVEFAGLYGHDPREVANVLADLDLKVSSVHSPMPTRDNIDQIAAEAEAFGHRRLVSGFPQEHMADEAGVRRCVEAFAQGCEVVRPHGLSLGMHNHWREFDRAFGGRTPYEILLESVPELFSELDIYWCARGGADVTRTLQRWPDRIPLLHVKDGDLTPEIVHKPVGHGRMPMTQILGQLPAGVEWLIVELDDCATDMFDAVQQSLAWLQQQGFGQRQATR